MQPERVEILKQEYTDQYVVVDGDRPELARFKEMVGQVKTINFNGRALVQFDGDNNRGWYDIELDYLKVVDKPEPKTPPVKAKAAESKAKATPAKPADKEPSADKEAKPSEEKLSPLELARMEKAAQEAADAPKPAPDSNEHPAAETPPPPDVAEAGAKASPPKQADESNPD